MCFTIRRILVTLGRPKKTQRSGPPIVNNFPGLHKVSKKSGSPIFLKIAYNVDFNLYFHKNFEFSKNIGVMHENTRL